MSFENHIIGVCEVLKEQGEFTNVCYLTESVFLSLRLAFIIIFVSFKFSVVGLGLCHCLCIVSDVCSTFHSYTREQTIQHEITVLTHYKLVSM